MEQHCLRHTELPGASRLFIDLLYHFDRVERFYAYPPHNADSLVAAAREVLYPAGRRAQLIEALRSTNEENASLSMLAQPDAVAVVTGQQVGLFGGPLYTIFKALSAVRLAESLRQRGVNAVPVFWLATEDHDLDEINQSWLFDAQRNLIALRTSTQATGGPVGPLALRDTPIDALRQTLAGHPFGEEVSERIASSYADGVSFGEAFRRLLQGLLGKYGLLFLDPLSPGIRSLAAPFLARALGQSRELVRMVRERTGELERAGYHGQVHLEPNSTFFFSLENGKRVALKKTDEGFNHLPLDQLTAHAERLSPNALLRPVMQDYLLPTIAYLGGPAELAYLAQSEPLYRTLLGRMPVATHRASFTLLDARAAKLMRRHSLELRHVTVPEVTLRETIAGRLIPHDLSTRFDNARQSISAQMEALAGPILAFDPSIGKALKKAQAKVAYQVEKLQAKVARERFRRDERAAADASYLHTSLYPHRHLQERFFGLAPFLARHGMDLVDRVHDVIKPECPDHQILILD